MQEDPDNNAQNLKVLNGKLLRIAVDPAHPNGYTIPPDNPFKGNQLNYRKEIFAYGLRNPFRFSIDSVTNQIWLGDVGQSEFEEINLVTIGGNFGWLLKEADDCFNPSINCDQAGLRAPVFSYRHGIEGYSVTGGSFTAAK